jgi:hypothetical protein
MAPTTHQGSQSLSGQTLDRRVHRAVTFGAWCFLLVGVLHLAVMAVSAMGSTTAPTQRALDAMHAVPVTLLGISRDMATLYYGFSATMAVVAIGYGVINLMVARLAPEAFVRGPLLLWANLVVAAAALLVAILAFPIPPVVALTAAVGAYVYALVVAGRRSA